MLFSTHQNSFSRVDVDGLAQLEKCSNELAAVAQDLANYSRRLDAEHEHDHDFLQPTAATLEAHQEIQNALASILSNTTRIRSLVCGPTDFLKHLASQNELLASMRWLGEFQILACIPTSGSVTVTDVANLCSVPEAHLARIVRLTTTMGFLCEPQPGHVAHTPLSAPFVTNPSFLDAAMFLAEFAAPAALHMAPMTHRFADSNLPMESAWNLALNMQMPFHNVRGERPKLKRQYSAYLHHAAGLHTEKELVNLLTQLNWSKLGNACIVEVGAQSVAMAQYLADLHPGLRLVVQMDNSTSKTATPPETLGSANPVAETSNPRITITCQNKCQSVVDASVYILHLPPSSDEVSALLQEHMRVLRATGGVMLLLTARLLPEPGTLVNYPEVEAVARTRDLSMLQLANEREMEMIELLNMIEGARDNLGELVITDQLRTREGLVIALVVKHQAFAISLSRLS